MDQISTQIVEELQRNARITNRALSTKVGLAPSSTLARVRDLEQRGTITGYRAEVDLEALGRPIQAMIFVSLVRTAEKTVNEFLAAVRAMPETVAVYLVGGSEDALVHVAVPDVQWLRQTVLSEISEMPTVADERTSLIFDHLRAEVIEDLGVTR